MPTIDIAQGLKSLSRYDVVGQQVEGDTRFVKHVALLDADNISARINDEVKVIHMGPPLEQRATIKIHVAGSIPLTNDEIKTIFAWFNKIIDEYPQLPGRQYVIHPPWKDERDPNTNTRRYRRYSCAGFVLDSHQQVNVELLDIDEEALPPVDRQTIISAYPDAEKHPELLRYWGLDGGGPWKVVLAGYIMHALDRTTQQIRQGPYNPIKGDEQF
jgi:hypothetical protein